MVLHVLASFASLHAAIAHRYKHTVCQHRSRQDDHSQNHPIMVFHSRTAFKTNPMAKCERTGCEDSQDKLQPHFDESTHVPKVELRALPRERDVARTRRPEGGRDYGGSATTSGGGSAMCAGRQLLYSVVKVPAVASLTAVVRRSSECLQCCSSFVIPRCRIRQKLLSSKP